MLDVTVLLLSHNLASTALAPVEVFYSAGSLWSALTGDPGEAQFNVTVASVSGDAVTSPYAISLRPQVSIAEIDHADIVVVPASGLDLDGQFQRNAALFPWLRRQHATGAHVAAVCSGAAFLAEAGLLDGRQATTHWAVAGELARRYPLVDWCPDRIVTEDRRVLCSAGVYAAIDLSLYLVEKFCGHEVALNCARSLLVDMPRSHQSGYALLPLSRPHDDDVIRAVEAYLSETYARDHSVEELARRANMSGRTFIRRFKAATGRLPGNYVQALRVALARRMLEEGARNIQAVAMAVGYDDVAFFRGLFKRNVGMTPSEYRGRFGTKPPVSPSRGQRDRPASVVDPSPRLSPVDGGIPAAHLAGSAKLGGCAW